MKSLNIYIEGLLNKSNKSSVLNVGDEIVNIIREKAAKTNTRGSVDWDPAKKVLHLKGDYSDLLDCEIINLLNTIPGVTLKGYSFYLETRYSNFEGDLVINFDINVKTGSFFISNCKSVSMQNCTFKITDKFGQEFNIHNGNLSFENVKFVGNKKYATNTGAEISIAMFDPGAVPTFKNVELQNMSLLIICPAWKRYYDKVKECIENDTNPGDVLKMLGLDGITKENLKDLKKPYIEIKCPFRPGAGVGESMKISRVKPKYEKCIEQNGWFIYFS